MEADGAGCWSDWICGGISMVPVRSSQSTCASRQRAVMGGKAGCRSAWPSRYVRLWALTGGADVLNGDGVDASRCQRHATPRVNCCERIATDEEMEEVK